MFVLTGLPGPLGCKTLRGSSQDEMVSLDTAPTCSCSGCPGFTCFGGCDGWDSDRRGSVGSSSSLRLCLFTKGCESLSSGPQWAVRGPPPPGLISRFPLAEWNALCGGPSFNQRCWKRQSHLSFLLCYIKTHKVRFTDFLLKFRGS